MQDRAARSEYGLVRVSSMFVHSPYQQVATYFDTDSRNQGPPKSLRISFGAKSVSAE